MTQAADHIPPSRPGAHGRGMAGDLALLDAMVARRRALRWVAGTGAGVLIAGCGAASGRMPGAAAVAGPGAGACLADPAEVPGPFPADGTNRADGSTSNVLTVAGIVRSDIRASFIGGTAVATGVPVTLTLTLADVRGGCAPLAGHAIYLWGCDRNGDYSLYGAAAESYLRGVQVTDARGRATFTTIFPACYSGRWPHLHFEVFRSLAGALGGRDAVLTSQLAMPAGLCATVFADAGTYPASRRNLAQLSLADDMVFGDGTAARLAQQTPAFSGSPAAGLVATATIGMVV